MGFTTMQATTTVITADDGRNRPIPRLPLFAGRYEVRVFLMDDANFFPTGKTPKEKVGVLVDQAWRIE
jgi:hypothetical protein